MMIEFKEKAGGSGLTINFRKTKKLVAENVGPETETKTLDREKNEI